MNAIATQELYMIRLAVGGMEREDNALRAQLSATLAPTRTRAASSARLDACEASSTR